MPYTPYRATFDGAEYASESPLHMVTKPACMRRKYRIHLLHCTLESDSPIVHVEARPEHKRPDDRSVILAAIVDNEPVTALYTSSNGTRTPRTFVPTAIERHSNGNTTVLAWDCLKRAPRRFTLDNLTHVSPAF